MDNPVSRTLFAANAAAFSIIFIGVLVLA